MCRLLALVGPPGEAGLPSFQHLIAAPHALRRQAERGAVLPGSPPGHLDSWGIGWFDDAGQVSLLREVGSAADAASFVFAAETATRCAAGSGPASVLLGHLRKAVSGAVTGANAHPIRVDRPGGASLLLAHNGHLREPLLASLRDDLRAAGDEDGAVADCDTVVLAHWLGTRLNGPIEETLPDALNDVLERAKRLDDPYEAYTGVNLLIGVPGTLAVLRHFSRYGDYYTLYRRTVGDAQLIASERTDDSPDWELMPAGVLSCFSADGSAPPRHWTIA